LLFSMCGRFTLQIPPELLAEIFGILEIPVFPARYNIAPTQQAPVIRQSGDGRNHCALMRWGLIPSWAKDPSIGKRMINARSETVSGKPAFRHAVRQSRCIVPSSGFYEWREDGEGGKSPFYIRLKDGFPICFAGLWESWQSPQGEAVDSFTILTTQANRLITSLHERMPVILHPEAIPIWIDRETTDPDSLKSLYLPFPADLMEMWPVSPLVNSPRNDFPELIAPIA
jgi:putative SOS response-associated peptidase YedK